MIHRSHLPFVVATFWLISFSVACGASEQGNPTPTVPTAAATVVAPEPSVAVTKVNTVEVAVPPTDTVEPSPPPVPTAVATEPVSLFQKYTIGQELMQLAIADLNGDAKPDLAVTDTGASLTRILLNSGDGAFVEGPPLDTGKAFFGLAAGDLDGDSQIDLALALSPEFEEWGILGIFLNNGDGTFTESAEYEAVNSVLPLVSDVDGDQDLDVIVDRDTSVISTIGAGMGVWLNNGDGTFQEATYYDIDGGRVADLVADDFNGDSSVDIVARIYPEPNIAILLGYGDGTFSAPAYFATADLQQHDILAADLDGDSYPDVVTGSSYGVISVLLNNGDGTFQAPDGYDVGANVYSVNAFDMDGDASIDLVVGPTDGGMASLLTNRGDGTFELTRNFYFKGIWTPDFTLADLDGDGFPEMISYEDGGENVYILPLEGDDS